MGDEMSFLKPILFGQFTVTSQVFHVTKHSFAFVNLKPLLPGHVLVSPLRCVPRLHDLTPTEISDLFLTVQRVSRMVERVFDATSLNIAIQDGADAGQSVPHVHAHIIPRKKADMPNVDDVYQELESVSGDIGRHLSEARRGTFPKVDAHERVPRSLADMEKEAAELSEEMQRQVQAQ